MRGALLVGTLLLSWSAAQPLAAAPASSTPYRDTANRYCIELPEGHDLVDELGKGSDEPGPLLAAELPDGQGLLVVSRIEHPNRGAWRKDETFYELIEKGLVAGRSSARIKRRKRTRIDGVPSLRLDVRDGQQLMSTRFLFYRRFALSATVVQPTRASKGDQRRARRTIDSFRPCKAPTSGAS